MWMNQANILKYSLEFPCVEFLKMPRDSYYVYICILCLSCKYLVS